MNYSKPSFEDKIVEPHVITENLLKIKKHTPLIFTNGCFDILHRGHVTYLAQARALGASLIVALNTDESVKRLGKDKIRPINNLLDRMAVIASLEAVSYVTYFNEDTPLNLILQIRPDILAKGGDWPIENIIGSSEVLAYGGKVYSIPFMFNTSTTKLINKIRYV